MTDEPRFRPWGTVTPEFWKSGADAVPASAVAQLLAQVRHHAQPPQAEPDARAAEPPAPLDPPSPPTAAAPASVARAATQPDVAGEEPERAAVPEEFQDQVTAIYQAAEHGQLPEAAALAAGLDEQITAAYGTAHPHTINIQQLRGYIAARMGGNAAACRWFLHTTTLWIAAVGPRDALTQESARWAAATWQRIQAPSILRELAADLLPVLSAVEGPDSRAVHAVRAHLAAADDQTPRPAVSPLPGGADPRGYIAKRSTT